MVLNDQEEMKEMFRVGWGKWEPLVRQSTRNHIHPGVEVGYPGSLPHPPTIPLQTI